jgi:hypothetical protein
MPNSATRANWSYRQATTVRHPWHYLDGCVISFGGFLGMGEDYYPMPWASLQYDTNLGGYRVGVTEDQSKALPNIAESLNGIGQTAAKTKPSTTIIVPRCGTLEIRRLGDFVQPSIKTAQDCLAPTVSAMTAPRAPSGLSPPIVESRAV